MDELKQKIEEEIKTVALDAAHFQCIDSEMVSASADEITALFSAELAKAKAEYAELAEVNVDLQNEITKCRQRRNDLKSELAKAKADLESCYKENSKRLREKSRAEGQLQDALVQITALNADLRKKDEEIEDLKQVYKYYQSTLQEQANIIRQKDQEIGVLKRAVVAHRARKQQREKDEEIEEQANIIRELEEQIKNLKAGLQATRPEKKQLSDQLTIPVPINSSCFSVHQYKDYPPVLMYWEPGKDVATKVSLPEKGNWKIDIIDERQIVLKKEPQGKGSVELDSPPTCRCINWKPGYCCLKDKNNIQLDNRTTK